jgi:hypothetical protein
MDAERGFTSIANKDSKNLKYKTGIYNIEKSRGIVSGLAHGEYIDDSEIQGVLSPEFNQQESSEYMQMRTKEKMIVNQLQCFINTGIKVLVDYIRQQLLDQYIRMERKYKFKNKGVLYLLQLFNKDVKKML